MCLSAWLAVLGAEDVLYLLDKSLAPEILPKPFAYSIRDRVSTNYQVGLYMESKAYTTGPDGCLSGVKWKMKYSDV